MHARTRARVHTRARPRRNCWQGAAGQGPYWHGPSWQGTRWQSPCWQGISLQSLNLQDHRARLQVAGPQLSAFQPAARPGCKVPSCSGPLGKAPTGRAIPQEVAASRFTQSGYLEAHYNKSPSHLHTRSNKSRAPAQLRGYQTALTSKPPGRSIDDAPAGGTRRRVSRLRQTLSVENQQVDIARACRLTSPTCTCTRTNKSTLHVRVDSQVPHARAHARPPAPRGYQEAETSKRPRNNRPTTHRTASR